MNYLLTKLEDALTPEQTTSFDYRENFSLLPPRFEALDRKQDEYLDLLSVYFEQAADGEVKATEGTKLIHKLREAFIEDDEGVVELLHSCGFSEQAEEWGLLAQRLEEAFSHSLSFFLIAPEVEFLEECLDEMELVFEARREYFQYIPGLN